MADIVDDPSRQAAQQERSEMEDSVSSIDCLKEHEKLDVLLSKIPLRAQTKFLSTCDLILTCIDANSFYIVLGSNIGLIFVFSRNDSSIQRIKVASPNTMITSVRLHEGTDHMVAVGTSIGLLCAYCIPSKASLLEKKEIQKFEVKDVHKNYITCLEWSTNGMKLCSGDTKGHVVVTEVDFYEDKCTSVVLLIDASNEIVQLSYGHKVLAVSTVQKSYIVRLDLGGQIVDFGTGEENNRTSGNCGACFIPGVCKTDDALVYIARQDCCLLLADVKGEVKSEHSFSFPFHSEVQEIFLHSPRKETSIKAVEEFQFGKLKIFRDKEVVTWYNTCLVVLDPSSNKVVAFQNKFDSIVDIAVVNSGEIFVIQRNSGARVVRVAYKPEPKLGIAYNWSLLSTFQPPPIIKTEEKDKHSPDNRNSTTFNFLKKNLVNPLKKLDQHINNDSERIIINSNNIPNATIQSESPVPKDEKEKVTDNINSAAAINFLKKNLVRPLKKLDQHINSDAERIMITENIPEAKILSEPKPQVLAENGAQQNEEERVGNHLARNFNDIINDYPVIEGDSIVVKTKKHKKKRAKKGNHVVTILEHTKESLNLAEEKDEEHNLDETKDSEAVKEDGDHSALEALRRADSLLRKIKLEHSGEQVNEKRVADKMPENVDVHVESNEKNLTDISIEKQEDGGDGNSAIVESLNSEEEVMKSVSDCSNKLDNSTDSVNKKLEPNEDQTITILENGVSSSSNSLSDCVERALESLSVEDGTKIELIETNSIEVEQPKDSLEIAETDSKKSSSLTLNSLGHAGFFDSVEDSPMEDLYGRSVYSVGSTDNTSHYGDDLSATTATRAASRPTALSDSNSYCSPVDIFKYDFQNIAPKLDVNVWSELKTPTNIYSVSMSDSHIFYTDKTENIYHLAVKEKSVSWKKASGKANQISVSPSGHIIWSLHKKVVYAGTKISSRHPEGLKWVENVRNVDCITVDNNAAWYITQGGIVMAETRLSLEQPINRPKKVSCPYKLKYILCRYGVVWAITERLQLLVRLGITPDCPEGKEWKVQSRDEPPFMYNHLGIGHDEVGWAVDFLGQIWFCTGVTMDNPMGCGKWWQVPLTDSLLCDENTRHLIKEVAQKFDPVKFSHIISTSRGGLVTAGMAGVYLALDFNNVFNVCKGSIQGYQWMNAQPITLSSKSAWKLLCAAASHTNKGFVWAQHVNKDLYAFKQVRGYAKLIDNSHSFICLSANIFTVWGLTSDGRIMTRLGIDDFCPEGTSWQHLDLVQLRDIQIVHLSCSWMYVWAVDVDGQIYHRIGAKNDTPNQLTPIWLPIENFSHIVFTKVYAGPEEWMVWAIDNRRMIYTRKGIRDALAIGKEWVHVTGIQAMDMTLSRTGAWALTPSGEVYYRQHVTRENICGKYWKKIPGLFTKISASADDDLWGVTLDGELRQCNIQHVWRAENDEEYFSQEKVRSPSTNREELDWELV